MNRTALSVLLAGLLLLTVSSLAAAWVDEGWVCFETKTVNLALTGTVQKPTSIGPGFQVAGVELERVGQDMRYVTVTGPPTADHYHSVLATTAPSNPSVTDIDLNPLVIEPASALEYRQVHASEGSPCVRVTKQRFIETRTESVTLPFTSRVLSKMRREMSREEWERFFD